VNRDDIIRMAREAAGEPAWDDGVDWVWGELERFAALVAAEEREACAKVLESKSNAPDIQAYAFAIRERGAP
jgi:hypothetical protein